MGTSRHNASLSSQPRRGQGEGQGPQTLPIRPKKGGRPAAISQQNQTPTHFFIPHHFPGFTLISVPPSDTPDDAMSGEAGPAPGWRVLADLNPRPAATVSLRTWGWNEGLAVGCRKTWIP